MRYPSIVVLRQTSPAVTCSAVVCSTFRQGLALSACQHLDLVLQALNPQRLISQPRASPASRQLDLAFRGLHTWILFFDLAPGRARPDEPAQRATISAKNTEPFSLIVDNIRSSLSTISPWPQRRSRSAVDRSQRLKPVEC